MPFLRPGLPAGLDFYTRFHRGVCPPTLSSLDDFEELFLFRSESSDCENSVPVYKTFWLIHEHDDNLWILSMLPGIMSDETLVAWCNAPADVAPHRIAEQLVFEWLRSCARRQTADRINRVFKTRELSLDLNAVFKAASSRGETPLHDMVRHGDVGIAQRLIQSGADVNACDRDGRTPLHHAVLVRNVDLVRQLLHHGAQSGLRDKDGNTPLDFAHQTGPSAIIALLAEDIDGPGSVQPPHKQSTADLSSHSPGVAATKEVSEPTESAELSVLDVERHLQRGLRWQRRGEYLASRCLLEMVSTANAAPVRVVARAISALVRCRYFMGEIQSTEQGLEEACDDERFSGEARARVMLQRGLSCLKQNDDSNAKKWLKRAVQSEAASDAIRVKARLNLATLCERQGETDQALHELNAVIETLAISILCRSRALLQRGSLRYCEGQTQAAIDDFSIVLKIASPHDDLMASALIERSKCYEELFCPADVIRDLDAAVALGGCSRGDAAASLHNYGVRCNLRGQPDNAYDYFCATGRFGETSVWILTNAQVNRGCYLGDKGELEAAVTEFKLACSTPRIPSDVFARAIYNLGNARRLQKNNRAAIRHFTRVIDMPNPPDSTLAEAFCKRGMSWHELGNSRKAIHDLSRVLNMPDADTTSIANALLWTGICNHSLHKMDRAAEHFQKLIDLTAASEEMRGRAKWGLGDVRVDTSNIEEGRQLLCAARQELGKLGHDDLVVLLNERIQELDSKGSSNREE